MRLKAVRIIQSVALAAIIFALSAKAHAQTVQVVAIGDSNTNGFLVPKRNAFPAQMEASLKAAGYDINVKNRGVSGDTTAGMLARLDSAVPRGTRIAIVQGGYNDKRRGMSAKNTAANIEAILARLAARNVKVVLCNFSGAKWANIAREHQAILVPADICYDGANRGFDGLHMNRAGHKIVAARLTPVIKRLVGPP